MFEIKVFNNFIGRSSKPSKLLPISGIFSKSKFIWKFSLVIQPEEVN